MILDRFSASFWLGAALCAGLLAPGWAPAAVVGTTSVTRSSSPIDKPGPVSGQASVTTAQNGSCEVTVNWVDNYGRVVDRQVSTINTPATTSVPYSFTTSVGLTLLNTIQVSARFPATGDTLSPSSTAWELNSRA